MNILMLTNTFLPIVGDVSESVQRLKRLLQAHGAMTPGHDPALADGGGENTADAVPTH